MSIEKRGYKKHTQKHVFKKSFIAQSHQLQNVGKSINKEGGPMLKPVGKLVEGTAGLERVAGAGFDSVGAKNPYTRFMKNMTY